MSIVDALNTFKYAIMCRFQILKCFPYRANIFYLFIDCLLISSVFVIPKIIKLAKL